MSKQFKMKVYKFSNSTIFDNQEAVSEYNLKLISNLRKLYENTQDSHPEVCSKSLKTKNQVKVYGAQKVSIRRLNQNGFFSRK